MRLSYTQYDISNRTARYLLEMGAVRFQPDTPVEFTSGRKSPIYVDVRLVLGTTQPRADIVRMAYSTMCDKIGTATFQLVAGGETAGIPFAALLADRAHKPMIYVRKEPKRFGRCAQIEGLSEKQLAEGRKVLLVEDLCSDGGSKLNFVNAIRLSGNIVNDILVIYAYECFGAVETLARDGVRLIAMTNSTTLVDVAEDLDFYPPHVIDGVRKFLADPDAYAAIPVPEAA